MHNNQSLLTLYFLHVLPGVAEAQLKAPSHLDVWRERVNIVWENHQHAQKRTCVPVNHRLACSKRVCNVSKTTYHRVNTVWVTFSLRFHSVRERVPTCQTSVQRVLNVYYAASLYVLNVYYAASLLYRAKLFVIRSIIIFHICATLPSPELHLTEMVCFQCFICLHVFHILFTDFRLFVFMFDSRRFFELGSSPCIFRDFVPW